MNTEQYHYEREINRSNTDYGVDEHQEYCIKKMIDKIEELEGLGTRKISNYKDYSYGFAGGLKWAIGLLTGEIEE